MTHPVEKLWREHGLPEWFLGNGGTNTKLYALYDAIRAAQPRLFTGCLRDGVCRGVCRIRDCPNHDMVVAARVCVEPKQDGIVYPKEEK